MSFRRWIIILGIFFYIGLTLGSAYLLALPLIMIFLLGVASYWGRHSLDGVKYKRRFHYTRAFPGEQFPVTIEIENANILPLSWLRIQDQWPRPVSPNDVRLLNSSQSENLGYLTHILSLRWYERTSRKYNLVFRDRGVYLVGPLRLESGDLFGLYDQTKIERNTERLTVFPKLIKISELDLPPEDPFGNQRSRRRLFEDPNRPMGIREYQAEDSFRSIHWPATARTGQLQVKVFQPTSAKVLVVCLNVSTMLRYWEGFYPSLLEHMLEVAATLVSEGIKSDNRVGLISNGGIANSDQTFRIQPGRSPHQLSNLLQALAGVTPVVLAPFERFLLREIPKVPFGATLLILTAIYTDELAETLIRLKKHERQITLISLAEKPPDYLPGISTIHLPFQRDYQRPLH